MAGGAMGLRGRFDAKSHRWSHSRNIAPPRPVLSSIASASQNGKPPHVMHPRVRVQLSMRGCGSTGERLRPYRMHVGQRQPEPVVVAAAQKLDGDRLVELPPAMD